MPANAAGQRRYDRLALRRQPALSSIAYHSRGQHQRLHLVWLVAFELRTRAPPFSRAISSRCAITICFSSDPSPSSSTNRASSSARGRLDRLPAAACHNRIVPARAGASEKIKATQDYAAGYGRYRQRAVNLVQKWLGHAQLLTATAICADAVGAEERDIARRMCG